MSKAIIVVDLQNDFSDNGNLAVNGFARKFRDIRTFLNNQKDNYLIIASQDFHPINHSSFNLWPKHCVADTFGSELVELIKDFDFDFKIKKGQNVSIDDYSAFYNGGQLNQLVDELRNKKVDEVYICGVATDYCVKHTAEDALKLGFEVKIIDDFCLAIDKEKSNREILGSTFNFINSSDMN